MLEREALHTCVEFQGELLPHHHAVLPSAETDLKLPFPASAGRTCGRAQKEIKKMYKVRGTKYYLEVRRSARRNRWINNN